jgi:hypothetical protein
VTGMKIALAVLATVGCGSSSRSASPGNGGAQDCPSKFPRGEQATYTAPAAPAGITIAAPKLCADNEAYIKIVRDKGARAVGTKRAPNGGFADGCMTLPADATSCPVISGLTVMEAAHDQLVARHIEAAGPGLGPCGDVQGDYYGWNMSVEVLDWKDAATAVQVVSDLLEQYDLRGTVGVAVVGVRCFVPL